MTQLDDLYHAEWGRLLSALIRAFGDFDLAEDSLQDAFTTAVVAWSSGQPRNPRAWLYTAARHNAIDQLRRRAFRRQTGRPGHHDRGERRGRDRGGRGAR